MQRILLILALVLIPAAAFGHPGKTDYYGGHHCLKGCAEWGLYTGEYHLHDKDGKPIRVKQRKKRVAAMKEGREAQTIPPVTRMIVTYSRAGTVLIEKPIPINPYLFALLVLLILLLIVRMNRRRDEV